MGAIHRLMQTIVMTGDGDSDAVNHVHNSGIILAKRMRR